MTCTIASQPFQTLAAAYRPRGDQLRRPPGSLGLAAVFDEPDLGECVGSRHVFYPSESITWLGILLPRPADRRLEPVCGHTAGVFTSTRSELVDGVPTLNFSNIGQFAGGPAAAKPAGKTATAGQRVSLLSGLSPRQDQDARCVSPQSTASCSSRWMPRPYLGYDGDETQSLLDNVTLEALSEEASSRFFQALRHGLPLHVPVEAAYTRVRPTTRAGICAHGFTETASGRQYVLYVPRSARIEARVGDVLAPRTRWCLAAPCDSSRPAVDSYGAGTHTGMAGHMGMLLLRLWFANQSIRLPWRAAGHYFRSELVAPFMSAVPATSLAWDMAPAEPFTSGELPTAVFPPLVVPEGDPQRLTLPGRVEIRLAD